MEAGTGSCSYARNSKLQGSFFDSAKDSILKAMATFDLSLFQKDKFCITDMGCSSGPNTANAVDFVISVIARKLDNAGSKLPLFQVFFSDLKATDFNTLFKFLPEKQGQPYFYAAAPGSFYDRLFPDSSVHFVMCNMALHFLSKVPPVVNDGKVVVDTRSPEAFKKFKAQAHVDLRIYLTHRLQEIVPGGLLVLVLLRTSQREATVTWETLELAWKDLIDEGLVSQQTLDLFNLPVFVFRNAEDIELAVTEVKGFKIVRLDYTKYTLHLVEGALPHYMSNSIRAIFGPMILQQLGSEHLTNELFTRYEARLEPSGEDVGLMVAILQKQDMV